MRIRFLFLTAVVALGAVMAAAIANGQQNRPAPARGARNARVARHDVRGLLSKLVLPAGATQTAHDPGAGRVLAEPALAPDTSALVDIHRFWRVAGEQPGDVLAWFQAHVPAGSSLTTSGSGSGPGYEESVLGYSFPNLAGVITSRELAVSITNARGGGTAIRVDAEDVYWVPKPKWERIPAGVGLIDVTVQRMNPSSTSHYTVTDMAKVTKIVKLVNALPPGQPGVIACPADGGPDVTLDFRSASGATPLATAIVDGSGCGGVSLMLRGKRAPFLSGGWTAVPRLGHLIGFS
jgi:hypothetical protein